MSFTKRGWTAAEPERASERSVTDRVCVGAALEEEDDNSHRIALRNVTILENILPFLAGLGLCSNATTGR